MNELQTKPIPGSDIPASLRSIIAVALSLAVLTAAVQVGILGLRHFVLGQFIWVSPHFVWMTPLAYIPYFAGLGVAVWAINLGVRRIAALDGVRPPSWQLPVLLW